MPPPPHPHPERRPAPRPDRRAILGIVWPIVLANAATPLLGLADTAVIGRYGTVVDLGAIALGALVFSFVYWGFGFLRMATTGFVAQADGAGDEPALRLAIARPLLLGVILGSAIVVLQRPIEAAALALLDGSADVEAITAAYLRTRIWGAPAALATYAVTGALIGLGLTRRLLVIQLAVNALNIGLDVAFAGPLGLGAAGVALGTAIAEWFALGLSLALLVPALRRRRPDLVPFVDWSALLDPAALRGLFAAQLDIMIRTLALLAGFGWFTNQGARFGDVTLAANHLLLQLVSFCAFVLDGFAFATESLVGRARGAGDRGAFDHAVRRTTELAALSALLLAGVLFVAGGSVIDALTDLAPVRAAARGWLPHTIVYVVVSVVAFQLDGVFIGATCTRQMRDASLAALAIFLGLSWVLVPRFGNAGLWWAFVGYVIARGAALGVLLPGLRRAIEADVSAR